MSSTNMLKEEKITAFGELKLSDLPPVQELKILAPPDKLVKLGTILSIVDVLVVVESLKTMPPLDLDTILFRNDGTPLGQIFDVFGPVTNPHYSIRFTSNKQIEEKNITIGLEIYLLPQTDRSITKFAFVNEIRKIKGTDASWEHDNEPPEGMNEYSDDEEEQAAKRQQRAMKKQECQQNMG